MKPGRWFDRKFSFGEPVEVFPAIVERLDGTIIRLHHKIRLLDQKTLQASPVGGWSIQEHAGHLLDLEPLWAGRLQDILSGLDIMRDADLENRKTHEADHNGASIGELLEGFSRARSKVAAKLRSLDEKQVGLSARHPRLEMPMRIIDLFYFTAEHDDHHLARISELMDKLR